MDHNYFAPGRAITFFDIQDHFEGQDVFLQSDNTVSVRMKNGLGLQIMMVGKRKDFYDFPVRIGQMDDKGVIFGKYQNSIIRLNQNIADNFTLHHETFHFLREMGVITSDDIHALQSEFAILKKTGNLTFSPDDNEEENLASTFAQVLVDRKKYRGTFIGRIIQKATDFVDGMLHVGEMTIRKMAREVESGKIFSRKPDIQVQPVTVPQYEKATAEWYSQMRNVIEQKLTTGPAEMVKAQIQAWARKGEFKKEELEWSGLLDWLDGRKGKVTKRETLNYLDQNQLVIKEVVKGKTKEQELIDAAEQNGDWLERDRLTQLYSDPEQENPTKFFEYQEPGGSNYKELLLILSLAPGQFDIMSREQLAQWYEDKVGYNLLDENPDMTTEKLRASVREYAGEAGLQTDQYISSHFPDDPNLIVHVRMNERTDPNGERVLFLEEVQSDWHQEARRKGYRSEKNIKEYEKRNKEAVAALSDIGLNPSPYDLGWVFSDGYEVDARTEKAKASRQTALKEMFGEKWVEETKSLMDKRLVSDIPDAPFKTTWPLLAIKKIVRYAAENGFAKIAWTTGETQVDRYDLSKQIKGVEYNDNKDGTYWVSVDLMNGDDCLIGEHLTPDEIEPHVGKELTEKIINGVGEKIREDNGDHKQLSGLDLKVGGEGLKTFYDHILPAEVNKFFNKSVWGHAKVEQVNFRQFDIGLSKQKGGGYVIADIRGAIDQTVYKTKKEAQVALKAYKGDLSAWALPITPQMRQKALREGMPMFLADKKTWFSEMPAHEFKQELMTEFCINPGTYEEAQLEQMILKDTRFEGQNIVEENPVPISTKKQVEIIDALLVQDNPLESTGPRM